jgi:hypothetical protein
LVEEANPRLPGRRADAAASNHLLHITGTGTQHHALQRRRFAIDRILIIGDSGRPEHCHKADEMGTGRSANTADPVRIDAEWSRMMAGKSHGALDVIDRCGVMEPGRAAVIYRKNRVPGAKQRGTPPPGCVLGPPRSKTPGDPARQQIGL